MNVDQLAQVLRADQDFMENVTRWEVLPARPARYADYPDGLDERLREVLRKRGIPQLYTHQAQAVQRVLAG